MSGAKRHVAPTDKGDRLSGSPLRLAMFGVGELRPPAPAQEKDEARGKLAEPEATAATEGKTDSGEAR
jgi:hypothetical protein